MLRRPNLIDTLRRTLKQLEDSEVADPDNPAWADLRRSIVLAIADLESRENERSAAA